MPTYDVEMDLSTMQVGFMEGGSSVANVQECSEPNFALVVTENANLIAVLTELSLLGFESTELVVSEGTSENLQESIDLTMSKVKVSERVVDSEDEEDIYRVVLDNMGLDYEVPISVVYQAIKEKKKAIADAEKQSSNQAESVVPRPQSVGKT
ncbi:hypothetical protein AMTRI_Chr01g111940 [Amborella trichopoda]